jgi:exopolysaccharide production protein ExoQ
MHADVWHSQPAARAAPRQPAGAFAHRLDLLALAYLLAISAGAFGFVDVMAFGDAFESTSQSRFAQLLWPLAYLGFAALILARLREVLAGAARAWWLLALPLVALLSLLWSGDPGATFGGAVRLAATTAFAIYLGVRLDAGTLARAVFWVLLLAVGASVAAALGGLDFATMRDGTVRGLFHHKNTLGNRSALLVVVALALLVSGWRPWLAAIGAAIGAAGVVLSSSAAGMALGAIGAVAAPVALALGGRGLGGAFRLMLIGALACLAAAVLIGLGIDPLTGGLAALDRDATLTGRLLLWEAALGHMGEHPWLGVGFAAFWSSGVDWRTLLVLAELGNVLHFHNAFFEVGVQLGLLGLLAAALACIGYGRTALLALRLRQGPVPPWPAVLGVVALGLALVEHELFVPHNLMQILFTAVPVAVLTGATREAASPQILRP